jgi:hypothetical protein
LLQWCFNKTATFDDDNAFLNPCELSAEGNRLKQARKTTYIVKLEYYVLWKITSIYFAA